MRVTLKKWLTIAAVLGITSFQGLAAPTDAAAQPTKNASEVPSVDGYVQNNFVILDHLGASRKGELDLSAIGAYNDPRRLRVDMNLRAPYNGRTRAMYA